MRMRWGLIILAAAVVALGLSGAAYAFHSGGVAECSGCHSMHSSAAGSSYLLVGADQSSTCLSCHEKAGDTGPGGYHISTPAGDFINGAPIQRTPGGDFGWLRVTYTYMDNTATPPVVVTERGSSHGHSIVAVDKGYASDPDNATAPGSSGLFQSTNLACNSCHDPHGQNRRLPSGVIAKTGAPTKGSGSCNTASCEPTAGTPGLAVGVYRLLGGSGYASSSGKTPSSGYTGAPIAKAPSTYNQKEDVNQVRVAYGIGGPAGTVNWGTWCQTCHVNMHLTGGGSHPVDQAMDSGMANTYNQYVKSGDKTGVSTASFLSLAPFVEGTSDYAALASHANNDGTNKNGPTGGTDQVSCISCHRAHASGWLHGLRFDVEYEFMVVNGNYIGSDNPSMTSTRATLQHRGRTMAQTQASYYDRPATQWATYQRVLCNKCHGWD